MNIKPFIGVILALMLTACHHNTGNQTAELTPGKSGIYVYRMNSRLGADQKDVVYIDDQKVGRIQNGRFLKTALKPGKHTLKIYDRHGLDAKAVEHQITIRPGQVNFVKIQWAPNGNKKKTGHRGYTTWLPKYGPKFVNINHAQGRKEVRGLKQS